MMGHCTLYIKQGSNKLVSKFSLSCFHQIPLVNIFPSHGLYISNMVSNLNHHKTHFLLSCLFHAMAKNFSLILQQERQFKAT